MNYLTQDLTRLTDQTKTKNSKKTALQKYVELKGYKPAQRPSETAHNALTSDLVKLLGALQ